MKLAQVLKLEDGYDYFEDLMSVIDSPAFCEAYERADYTEMGALISRYIDGGIESAEADASDVYEPLHDDAGEIREATAEMRRAFK